MPKFNSSTGAQQGEATARLRQGAQRVPAGERAVHDRVHPLAGGAGLRSLPVGTAYAVWVGIGALGVAVAGIVARGEPASAVRLVFLALIVIGVAGLKLVET